jgi:hypothetical protein
MKRTILLLALAATLTGCLHGRGDGPVVEAGAPKATKSMDWAFTPTDTAGALTYGGAGNVKLMLACAKRSGSVTAGRPVSTLPEGTKTLTLVSGSVKSTSLGVVQAAPSDPDTQVLAAKYSTMDPIMQAFDNRGWVSVPGDKGRLSHLVPQAGNRAVKNFFAFCG